MSGGYFDYNQYRINDIADRIERELNRQGKEKPKDELYGDKEYFVITDINCQATEYGTKAKYYINKENGLVEKIEMKHEDNSVSIVTHEYKFDVVTDKDF